MPRKFSANIKIGRTLCTPAEESQAVLETFDGHIDLYEVELQVRPKLICVRKLGGRKFLDNELLVEREKI